LLGEKDVALTALSAVPEKKKTLLRLKRGGKKKKGGLVCTKPDFTGGEKTVI